MNKTIELNELRELFLSAPESDSARILAITFSFLLVATVLWLVRHRVLREEYTPIWMGAAVCLVVASVSFDLLNTITRLIGAWTTSSTIFFLGELFLFLICLNYAVRLSKTSLRLKNLAQEMALLKAQVEQIESDSKAA
ncbi:DUF2304 domain-containing protein [Myxococcota bacterium]|jgi:hypothetical protein|nr:DUF2304 domain-containing protein [Myxococcota bacterium]